MVCEKTTGEALIRWFLDNKRVMPWREDPTPYHVYLSEIMLQQTRVESATPYYHRFLGELPDIRALSECDDDRLLKLWEGLGYYSRVRNMKKAAQKCVELFDGEIPDTREALESLPGIGSYTAGAILSIAYGKPESLADGNVLRVLMRLTGRRNDIADPKTKEMLEEELREFLVNTKLDPSAFNQGLMELGALVCIPNGEPKCEKCPWNGECAAHLQNLTGEIPVKTPKKPRKIIEKTVLFLKKGDSLAVVKNEKGGLLAGLYGWPSVDKVLNREEVEAYLRDTLHVEAERIEALPEKKHIFTHAEWHMTAFCADIKGDAAFRFCNKEALSGEIPIASAYKKWNLDEFLHIK